MSSKRDAFCKMIENKTGRLVVVLENGAVVIPANVGQTKKYGVAEFLSDYYIPDHASIQRFMSFLKTANEKAAKRLKGKLGFVNKCLDANAEVYILNPESKRGSDHLFTERMMVDYDHIRQE